ncbi:DNA polymerase Y family protein [Zhongshania guokunii]|uniref:DNA polymerase Y family protein n=1 Tax=Zhongshania guokunii TaxID=641783 RepID=A0ABV3U7P8_9GAMM
MLWLCLRLPSLPLDALGPQHTKGMLALSNNNIIVMANAAAQQAGIAAGMSVASALSLSNKLELRPRDEQREQQHLANIALWAYRFSGDVCLCPPNAVLLELGASLRLFKNLARLYRKFISAFRRRGLSVQLGIAHTPLAAELLSHQNLSPANLVNGAGQLHRTALDNALRELPIGLLPLAPKTLNTLQEMGMHTLGNIQALPRAALERRFGKNIVTVLAKLQGEQPDIRPKFTPPETFHAQRHFDGGLHSKQQLRFPISALLSELEHYLRLRQCLNRDLEWTFHYLDGSREAWSLDLSHRHFDRRSLIELVMLRLERLSLQGPVESLSLSCTQFIGNEQHSDQLFDTANHSKHQEKAAQVLDKLRLRLGAQRCHLFSLQDAHLPELNWVLRDAHTSASAPSQSKLKPILKPVAAQQTTAPSTTELIRPNCLCHPPEAITETTEGLFWQGELHLLQGPERFDGQWWQQRQTRDYYIARHQHGALCWVFKDCLNRRWYLHGFFA